jgi:hypothetical protein
MDLEAFQQELTENGQPKLYDKTIQTGFLTGTAT